MPYEDRLGYLNVHSRKAKAVRKPYRIHKFISGLDKEDIPRVLAVKDPGKTRGNGFKSDKFRFNKHTGKKGSPTAWWMNGRGLAVVT